MPEISRFFGIIITMNYNDHAPPHFHARYGGDQALVDIQTLQANGGLRDTALTDAAQAQPWDPSVQALVVFPAVLSMMDNNLQWTINLGNAVLAQEQDVMDAIQRQRQRAMAAGRLASSPQQVVQQTTDTGQPVIAIEPAQPETMYVPVYDPVAVWGPPVYHPWPAFWYPPRPAGAVIAAGFLGFFVGVTVAPYFRQWGGWGWGAGGMLLGDAATLASFRPIATGCRWRRRRRGSCRAFPIDGRAPSRAAVISSRCSR